MRRVDQFHIGEKVKTSITDRIGVVTNISRDDQGVIQKVEVDFGWSLGNFLWGEVGKSWQFPSMIDSLDIK